MRIGLSTSVIQRGKTGIAQYLFALLRAFDEMDREDEFVLYVLDEDQPLFAGLSRRFTIVPVAERFRPAVKNIRWHQLVLPGLARAAGLDAMHVPSYRRLMWTAPCPRIGTIHDLAPFHLAGKYDLTRMFYGRVVVKRLARRQEALIAVSENTARDLTRFFGIPRGRVTVIHNGVDGRRFYPRNRETARAFAVQAGLARPYLLYVARLEHPGKNHVRLIGAFEVFKTATGSDWQLAFGGSDWHGAETIHRRIASSPYRAEIKALGFVADADLPNLYSAASLFVYPSLFEGFGMPPVEAMACGCPAICSDRGALGEVVGNAARIVDPENVQNMAEALRELWASGAGREKWAALGRTRAAELSWERAARETLAVYARAAGKGARGRQMMPR